MVVCVIGRNTYYFFQSKSGENLMTIQFVQVNTRNSSETIDAINNAQYSIGFEVIEKNIVSLLDDNIDPQHGNLVVGKELQEAQNISASLWFLQKHNYFSTVPEQDVTFVLPSKLDLDCIVAATLCAKADNLLELESYPNCADDAYKFQQICDIVREIDVVDCGLGNIQGNEWNPNHQKQQLLSEITWYQIISAFIADFKVPIEEKVEKVWQWLLDGDLTPFETWERSVRREALEQKQSRIDNIYGVTVVESHARGATGVIYSVAPFGVAFNSRFPTKDGEIAKFTICEFTAGKYIDLQGILDEIGELESGWGGNLNAGVIGSPFGGTELGVQQVAKIVSRHLR
jgi:hypothetical protein